MKKLCLLVIIALLLIPAGVSAVGNIYIITTPSGATVTVDGENIGTTPCNNSFSATSHTVVLTLSGYADYSATIPVTENYTEVLNHVFVSTTTIPPPSITGITPNNGFNTSTLGDVVISGTGFSASRGTVVLRKSGQDNITASINSWSATSINCDFPIEDALPGTWSVIVTNADGRTDSYGFTVKTEAELPTLTSVDPTSGEKNTSVSVDIYGTNFASDATIRLVNPYHNDIIGTGASTNTAGTRVSGTFNLNGQAPAEYEVCVYNTASVYVCNLTFTVLSPGESLANSSIYFDSYPAGATVYLNRTEVGTTTFTKYNVTPGTYQVVVRKSGYRDYTANLTVPANKRVSFYAQLTALDADTTATTAKTATTTRTATTVKKSTLKVPTTWATTETSQESPVDPVVLAGAIGLAFAVLRKR